MQTQYYCWSAFSLRALNYAAAIFHLIQAAIVLGFIQHLNHQAESSGDTHGLTSGVYNIKKSFLVIQNHAPTVHYDQIWTDTQKKNENTAKCSLTPVEVYNMTDLMRQTPFSLLNTSAMPPAGRSTMTMISSFASTSPHGILLNAKRNDIYMFDGNYVIPQNIVIGDLDIRYIIFSFFLLSGLFQLADGALGSYSGEALLTKPRVLRFVEYSFSASIMILAIAVQTGITDIYVLCCIFTLIFTTNILGFIAEIVYCCYEILGQSKKVDSIVPIPFAWWWTVPHFLGWITCLVGYAPLLDSYLQSTQCSDRSPPGFVHVIIFLEFVLFSSFGFVQLYSLYYRTEISLRPNGLAKNSWSQQRYTGLGGSGAEHSDGTFTPTTSSTIAEQADFAYIILSFVAKTLLAWLILSPVIMDANNS